MPGIASTDVKKPPSAHRESSVSRPEAFEHYRNVAGSVTTDEQSPFESATAENTYSTHSLETVGNTKSNCFDGDTDQGNSLRPAKRQKVEDSTSFSAISRVKAASPPWRRAEAEGPTSFTENGRRKSGRINTLPQDAGRRRLTRHIPEVAQSVSHVEDHGRVTANRGSPEYSRSATRIVSRRTSSVYSVVTEKKSHRVPSKSHQLNPRASRDVTKNRHSLRSATPNDIGIANPSVKQGDPLSHRRNHTLTRIRLRANTDSIPLVHPEQVPKRSKLGPSFEEFWLRAGDVPIERGGLLVSDEGVSNLHEIAEKEASFIIRLEKELESHGLFSRERCSLFEPDRQDEPPRQWARLDHLVRAMTNFRRLLLAEQQRHRESAKRLADACRDEWLRRQPRSFEQIELDKREHWLLKYRLVVRAVEGLWENVRAHVNKQRLEMWEAEEQKRVRAALNEAVCISEQKLQARQETQILSEDALNDTDLNGSNSGDDSRTESVMSSDSKSYDSDIMSSSDDVDDSEKYVDLTDFGDEELSQDQLRIKYANFHKDESFLLERKPYVFSDCLVPTTVRHRIDSAMEPTGERLSHRLKMQKGQDCVDLASYHEGSHEVTSRQQSPISSINSEGKESTKHNDERLSTVEANSFMDPEDDILVVRHQDTMNGDVLGRTLEAGDVPSQWVTEFETGCMLKYTSGDPGNEEFKGIAKVHDVADSELDYLADTPGQYDVITSCEARPSIATAGSVSSPLHVESVRAPITADPLARNSRSEQRLIPWSRDNPSGTEGEPLKELHLVKTDRVSSSEGAQSIQVPFLLRGTLREYQYDGLVWLATLYVNRTNGILADEMGLGKTIQTIALLAHLACAHEVWGPHLIVVPTSVMLNWEMEFKKWCPSFKVLSYYGSQDERKRKRQGWNNDDIWNVCITSYQLVLQDQQVFRRRRWHYLVLDEAHNIKNFKSQRWQTLLGFNTHSRLLLTGTPLQNNLTELWSLLFFLMPPQRGIGGFADLEEFYNWFQKPETQILESGRDQMDDEAKAIILKLHKVLRPYLLRRLKADVEKQLPNKYEHVNFCRLSKRQRELYDGFLARTETRATLVSGNHLSIINCLMQLRKVCNHPDLFIDRPIVTSLCMQESVASHYAPVARTFNDRLKPRDLMQHVNLQFLNLIPTQFESLKNYGSIRSGRSEHYRTFLDLHEAQKIRALSACVALNPTSVDSSLAYLEGISRWDRFEELQNCVYLNTLRSQQMPLYGEDLINLVNIFAFARLYRPTSNNSARIMQWLVGDSTFIRHLTPSVQETAHSFDHLIRKFSCVTPAVVAKGLESHLLGNRVVNAITEVDLQLSTLKRWNPLYHRKPPEDPWHEARMRLSIQFPDKRLLQYDCGKLQALDNLLRTMQSNGHRALIFTQMTRVLDILERFLNIHGYRYLRLDGATKVEQRQILTDRFNQDSRILCFILSTRSGGLGINLTGADTVIFYDQDWNPAMDKQCQDRCHRIGQTRDVHIYRLVSEHTIEANILRKASQKQMLDDIVIREGEFTTSKLKQVAVRDILAEKIDVISMGVAAADVALERVLDGSGDAKSGRNVGEVLAQAEDREDATAARIAEREIQADDVDFIEKSSCALSRVSTERLESPGFVSDCVGATVLEGVQNVDWNQGSGTVDDFMLHCMTEQLRHTELTIPRGKKKKARRKGRDTRKR